MLKLLRVWFRIVNFVEENTDEGAGIILDVLNAQTGANMAVEGFKIFWQGYEHYPLNPSEIERDILSRMATATGARAGTTRMTTS